MLASQTHFVSPEKVLFNETSKSFNPPAICGA